MCGPPLEPPHHWLGGTAQGSFRNTGPASVWLFVRLGFLYVLVCRAADDSPSRQGLNSEDPRTDLSAYEEFSCPCRRVCCASRCNHRARRIKHCDNGAASRRHLARQTKRGGSAYRTCRACTALHDCRSVQEWAFARTGPRPQAARARLRGLEMAGRRQHDARYVADPGQLRQRRLIPDAFQSDPLEDAQGHSGTLAQPCALPPVVQSLAPVLVWKIRPVPRRHVARNPAGNRVLQLLSHRLEDCPSDLRLSSKLIRAGDGDERAAARGHLRAVAQGDG
jgi:hypothetical protein